MKRYAFLIVIALFVAFQVGAVQGGKPGKAPKTPADPAIVYEVPGTVSKLWVMNEDGSNKTVIHEGPRFERIPGPSWSPDGASVVFKERDQTLALDVDVINGAVVSSNLRTLATGPVGLPKWSPMGDEISTIYQDGTGNKGLYVFPATGCPGSFEGCGTLLYTPAAGSVLKTFSAWSFDANRIAFVETDDTENIQSIGVYDRLSGQAVLYETAFTTVRYLDWARHSNRLAFGGTLPGNVETVYILDLDSAQPALEEIVDGTMPSWSPDDSRLVYLARGLRIIDLVTGIDTQLSSNGFSPDWRR